VGYQDQQPKGYRIYLTSKEEFIITAHASFEDNLIETRSLMMIKEGISVDIRLKNCKMCRLAKATRSSFKGTVARAAIRGKCWYADIKGPFEQTSLVHGNKYVFGIIESKTRLLIQYYIKNKSDVEACLRSWYEKHIKALRLSDKKDELTHIFLNTDMGECTSHNKIIDYLATIGIELKTTCPHTPEQNMIIERVWRTIGESAIAMMLTSNMSETY